MTDLERFRPSSNGSTALFLDTSGLFAYFHPQADEHEEATAFLQAVGSNEVPYRPLYTSTYVVDELATLLLSKGTYELATAALDRTLDSDHVSVIAEAEEEYDAARQAFQRYDDHEISFTDQLSGVQMQSRDVGHVFAYDGDFRTLGFEQLPR
ncbi:type II toxin-antitoxin system VapC family toxin [Halorhabdus amylolytica]|uniref:type II toxin-antitoxin system VapC family toxin n=1 Tax=Halorhabdus amylolytica TaxID=2559573 RepID=UPI0010AA20F5|nr:PIN domain-containing protein [Halorhabdus amylolytica]